MRGEILVRTAQRYIAEGNDRYEIDQRALESILHDEMRVVRCLAELGAVATAGVLNCNPSMASSAAVNAVDNNWVVVLIPVALGLMKVYDIITTYQGAREAYEEGGYLALAQYGLEEAAITLLMGSAGKVAGKAAYKAKSFVTNALSKAGETAAPALTKHAPGVKGNVKYSKASDANVGKHKSTTSGAENCNNSSADALRLRTKLAFEEQGILNANGKLTNKAISESKQIKLKNPTLGNPEVVKVLTKDGSSITDWAKFKTQEIRLPNGQKREIHFYQNLKNGKIDYQTVDFKVKGEIRQ